MREREIIALTNKMVKDGIFEKAQFVWYAEPAAMGRAGEIIIVSDEGMLISGNYVTGKLNIDKVIEEFQYIGQDAFEELFANGVSDDGEIHYFYMESGNHLFMRDNVYEFFVEMNGTDRYVEIDWLDAATRICPDAIRRDKLNEVKFYCDNLDMQLPECYPFGKEEELDDFIECWSEYDPCPDLD